MGARRNFNTFIASILLMTNQSGLDAVTHFYNGTNCTNRAEGNWLMWGHIAANAIKTPNRKQTRYQRKTIKATFTISSDIT
jgi:hypothetical protein